MIEPEVSFRYDVERYGETLEARPDDAIHGAGRGEGKRIPRTRARFDCPWSVVGVADVDEELVDKAKLTAWLARGGRRIGLGDWRPEKQGGVFGRFDVEDVIKLAAGGAAAELPAGADAQPRPGSVAGRGGAGRPDRGRIATSDARVARRPVGDVAWHGGAGPWHG